MATLIKPNFMAKLVINWNFHDSPAQPSWSLQSSTSSLRRSWRWKERRQLRWTIEAKRKNSSLLFLLRIHGEGCIVTITPYASRSSDGAPREEPGEAPEVSSAASLWFFSTTPRFRLPPGTARFLKSFGLIHCVQFLVFLLWWFGLVVNREVRSKRVMIQITSNFSGNPREKLNLFISWTLAMERMF